MRHMTTVSLTLLILCAGLASATTIYVKPDGTGDVPTIQAAVDLAAAGDTVLLASGTFLGTGNHNVVVPSMPISIRSETGDPGDCILDCEGYLGFGRYALEFQAGSAYPVLEGVTITRGNSQYGAVRCYSSPAIRNCIFLSNQAFWGAACYCNGPDVVISGCTFTANTVNASSGDCGGGAILFAGTMVSLVVDSCTFTDNSAPLGGAIYCMYHEARADIRNSVFYHNSASVSGGALLVGNLDANLTGCTFVANSAPEGSGSGIEAWTSIVIDRCIVAYGSGGCGYLLSDGDPILSVSCTDIYGNEGGDWVGPLAAALGQDGNLSAAPLFCNYGVGPYDPRLCSGSPCLAGNHPAGYNCGLIGALGQGCTCGPTKTAPTTWGQIKTQLTN